MQVIKNYLYNVSYNLLTIILPIFTIPYITRVLNPREVGINSATNSVITYFLLAGTLGITIYGNREIATKRDDHTARSQTFWEIEFLQITTIAVSYIAFLLYLALQHEFRIYFFYQSFWIIAGAFDISWFFMGMENFKKTVVRNMLVKVISACLIFTCVKSPDDLGIYILILSLSQLIGNITLWPYLPKFIRKPIFSKLHPLRHLRPTLTLFIPQVAILIYVSLNKTMLWKLDSVTASGFYDYTDKITKIALSVVTSLGTVLLPRMSHLYGKKQFDKIKSYLINSSSAMLFMGTALAFGISAISNSIVHKFLTVKYQLVGTLLMIEAPVLILIALSNLVGQQYLLPLRRTKQYTKSVTLGAVTNIVLNIPLILLLGVKGSMISTVVSEAVVTGYQLWVIRNDIDVVRLFDGFYKYVIAGVCMFAIVFYLDNYLVPSYPHMALEILIGAVVYCLVNFILRAPVVKLAKEFLATR
ncbi:repeat unit transporter [Liquorilactobacillus aquaticus DSM 21051]|uniref:Repeat unit transporter n=1 Tax=Liquorilactobacillus aquaticus DSM 21051 TaxID=1423725 RepID=A0A0R2CU11_9LACO|nr:polysaccharide biosynthesis C-terminal domain-containing protein [Liquorilactobacillus aquaticus]KRM94890.1 repeat unit transporter [Liquorilactobacillus aquaticus DSM 21051]